MYFFETGVMVWNASVIGALLWAIFPLSIGSISTQLVLENGCPVEREIIHLNLGADHDLIDGAPLMRFAERFRKKLEGGYPAAHSHSAC